MFPEGRHRMSCVTGDTPVNMGYSWQYVCLTLDSRIGNAIADGVDDSFTNRLTCCGRVGSRHRFWIREVQMLRQLRDWLALRDYEEAIERARLEVVSRFARGNVKFQNGDVIDGAELDRLSDEGDRALEFLNAQKGDRAHYVDSEGLRV